GRAWEPLVVSWLAAEGDRYMALFEPVSLFLLPATRAVAPESTYKAPQSLSECLTPKRTASAAKRKDAAYHASRPCPENRKGRVHHSARCCGGQRSETHSIGCALVLVACVPMPAPREVLPPGFSFSSPAALIPRSLRIFRAP